MAETKKVKKNTKQLKTTPKKSSTKNNNVSQSKITTNKTTNKKKSPTKSKTSASKAAGKKKNVIKKSTTKTPSQKKNTTKTKVTTTKTTSKKKITNKVKTSTKPINTVKNNSKQNKKTDSKTIKNQKWEDLFGILVLIILAATGLYLSSFTNNASKPKEPVNASLEAIENTESKLPQDVLDLEDVKSLKEQYNNEDIIGLLYIPETEIKEPITQALDNDYYLKHNLYRNYDIQGTVFLDYRVQINQGRKNLIYSHNSHTIDVPFKELEGYYDKSYYENHKYIYI